MKYLRFLLDGTSESGKTKIWKVVNATDGSPLGEVKWYAPWRKYVYITPINRIVTMDWACATELATFLLDETNEHKAS